MALDEDPLQRSDLNSNSTRYDYFRAIPPASELQIVWITWSILAYIVAASSLILILSITSNPVVRNNPFNLDLVFLTFPDFLFSFLCATTCAMNASVGHYWSNAMCEFQSWYVVFGFSANMWMNAVIGHQLHNLLCSSRRRRRYAIPPRHVIKAAGVVYLYSAFLASWTMIGVLPHRANASRGNACVPLEYDLASTLFFWLAFVPAFMLIPFSYVLYVCWDVHRKRLLPSSGRRRRVALYFLRLLFIFVFMWTPTLILIFADNGQWTHWTAVAGGTWSHLQGLVSVVFSLTKPDVKRAVVDFLCCIGKGGRTKSRLRRISRAGSSLMMICSGRRPSGDGDGDEDAENDVPPDGSSPGFRASSREGQVSSNTRSVLSSFPDANDEDAEDFGAGYWSDDFSDVEEESQGESSAIREDDHPQDGRAGVVDTVVVSGGELYEEKKHGITLPVDISDKTPGEEEEEADGGYGGDGGRAHRVPPKSPDDAVIPQKNLRDALMTDNVGLTLSNDMPPSQSIGIHFDGIANKDDG